MTRQVNYNEQIEIFMTINWVWRCWLYLHRIGWIDLELVEKKGVYFLWNCISFNGHTDLISNHGQASIFFAAFYTNSNIIRHPLSIQFLLHLSIFAEYFPSSINKTAFRMHYFYPILYPFYYSYEELKYLLDSSAIRIRYVSWPTTRQKTDDIDKKKLTEYK